MIFFEEMKRFTHNIKYVLKIFSCFLQIWLWSFKEVLIQYDIKTLSWQYLIIRTQKAQKFMLISKSSRKLQKYCYWPSTYRKVEVFSLLLRLQKKGFSKWFVGASFFCLNFFREFNISVKFCFFISISTNI